MCGTRERIPDQALSCHDRDELEFAHPGPSILGIGKEALLTRLTSLRTSDHHSTIDFIFREAERRNAHVYTTTHVLAEVIGTIRSSQEANTVGEFFEDVRDSNILILEDGRQWDKSPVNDNGGSVFSQPIQQFKHVQGLYSENPNIDFKFHEATLGLNGVFLEERSESRNYTVYIATFDGALAALSDTLEIDVLPYRTELRDDGSYR